MVRKRLEIVQAYRGIAALLILLSHVSIIMRDYTDAFPFFNAIGRSGGVDFFFALSGFLIYYVYSGYRHNKAKVAAFMEKRCLRIYPLVWFFTLLSLPVYVIFNGIGNGNELNPGVIASSLLLLPQERPVLGATWSLSHIVLFYLMFALYLLYPAIMKIVAAILVTALLTVNYFTDYTSLGVWVDFLISPYNINFAAGALCAYFVLKYGSKSGYLAMTAGLSGYVFNWLAHYYSMTEIPQEPVYLLSSLCLLYGASRFDQIKRLPRIFNILGDSSYSIIITNLPLTILCATIMDKTGWFETAGFPLSIAMIAVVSAAGGVVSYYLVEKPLSAVSTQMYYSVKNKWISRADSGLPDRTAQFKVRSKKTHD